MWSPMFQEVKIVGMGAPATPAQQSGPPPMYTRIYVNGAWQRVPYVPVQHQGAQYGTKPIYTAEAVYAAEGQAGRYGVPPWGPAISPGKGQTGRYQTYETVFQAQATPPTAPAPDEFVGPCPAGTTQTPTGCAPNVPTGGGAAPAPAPKAPAAVGSSKSLYITGGIAAAVLLAAVLIPWK